MKKTKIKLIITREKDTMLQLKNGDNVYKGKEASNELRRIADIIEW